MAFGFLGDAVSNAPGMLGAGAGALWSGAKGVGNFLLPGAPDFEEYQGGAWQPGADARFAEDRAAQANALALMQGAAAGTAPSAAAQQMQLGQAEAARQQAAAAAGRGANPLAARTAMQAGAQAQTTGIAQAGALRAQEMAAARGQYGQMGLGMAQSGQQQAQLGLDLDRMRAQQRAAKFGAQSATFGTQAERGTKLLGGLAGAASGMAAPSGAAATSDVRAKTATRTEPGAAGALAAVMRGFSAGLAGRPYEPPVVSPAQAARDEEIAYWRQRAAREAPATPSPAAAARDQEIARWREAQARGPMIMPEMAVTAPRPAERIGTTVLERPPAFAPRPVAPFLARYMAGQAAPMAARTIESDKEAKEEARKSGFADGLAAALPGTRIPEAGLISRTKGRLLGGAPPARAQGGGIATAAAGMGALMPQLEAQARPPPGEYPIFPGWAADAEAKAAYEDALAASLPQPTGSYPDAITSGGLPYAMQYGYRRGPGGEVIGRTEVPRPLATTAKKRNLPLDIELAEEGAPTLQSDRRAKEAVREELRSMFDRLTPYSYQYKPGVRPEEPAGTRHMGVMAQDMEKSGLGEGMVDMGPRGFKQIDVPQLAGATAAAVADLHDRMKRLEARRAR